MPKNRKLFVSPAPQSSKLTVASQNKVNSAISKIQSTGMDVHVFPFSPVRSPGNNFGFKPFNPNSNAGKAWELVNRANNMLPPEHRVTGQKVRNHVDSGVNYVKSKVGNAFKNVPTNGSPSVMNSSYGLSKAPLPKPTNLNSGIMPATSSNDLMAPVLNFCSPLHMTGVGIQIPSTGSLYTYFTNTIAFDIQSRAQTNINFDLNIGSQLTVDQLRTAFNAVINALNIYFYYTSILTYESDSRNKNSGMIYLRQGISSQIISDLTILGRRLEDIPCPPRLVEYIRYLNSNYYSGDTQGSSLIKMCPILNEVPVPSGTTTAVSQALTLLVNSQNSTVFALLRRAIPKWRIGKLYDVPVLPCYDKNFLTIFANLPSSATNSAGTGSYSPTVALESDVVPYNSFNNRLDGAAFCLLSANINLRGFVPGFVYPVAKTFGTATESRISYYTDGVVPGFFQVAGNTFLTSSRNETYKQFTFGTYTTPHLSGADMCQNVNILALSQTSKNVMDFLFDVNSIPVNGSLTHFNRKGNNLI